MNICRLFYSKYAKIDIATIEHFLTDISCWFHYVRKIMFVTYVDNCREHCRRSLICIKIVNVYADIPNEKYNWFFVELQFIEYCINQHTVTTKIMQCWKFLFWQAILAQRCVIVSHNSLSSALFL